MFFAEIDDVLDIVPESQVLCDIASPACNNRFGLRDSAVDSMD